MNINKNFVGSRMNKSLDERLIPAGDYIDALNIRVSSDEDGEALTAENAKGNELLVTPEYEGSVLTNAKCIGAFEDGTNETIYWFVTSDEADMILSYNTRTDSIAYHVVSVTVLNFNDKYLMNGIDKIDDFLFFTDNYNQPRRINVKSSYPNPVSNVDQITEDDISVIVKPPVNAPVLKLFKKATKQNYMEDKFIRFAYRYKYKDGEYSALSEFSELAFTPGQFRLDYGSYDMVGMKNSSNSVNVSFNTGPSEVVGIDLCFKLSNSNVINVVEKYKKTDSGWADDANVTIEFTNQKIYTTLTESELLRLYDNVPKKAKAQTTVGNRIMYANYYDGYDIDTVIDYELDLINHDIGFDPVPEDMSNGSAYTLSGSSVTITDSRIDIDLTDVNLLEGGSLNIDFNIRHDSFGGDNSYVDGNEVENRYQETFEFIFPRDYTSVHDLATDADFLSSVELTDPTGFPGTESDGYSLSDLFFSNLTMHASGDWGLSDGGITSSDQGFVVTYSVNTISIQVPSVKFESTVTPGTYAYEYFLMAETTASVTEQGNRQSLHSNRDYEVGVVYLDEYNRASTALVCNNNTVYVEPQDSINKNSVKATIKHLAPSWAKRYRLVMKPSKGNYETIYSKQYYFDEQESVWWVKLEGDNQTKFKNGDNLIVKRSSAGPTTDVVKTKVLDLGSKTKGFIDDSGDNMIPPTSGIYMKLRPTQYNISEPEYGDIDKGSKTKKNGYGLAYPTYIEDDENPGTYKNYDIPSGSEIRFYFSNHRNGSGYRCGSRRFKFERTFTATRDYNNLYDFILGENIDFNNPTNSPATESSDDTTPSAAFDESVGVYDGVPDGIFQGGYNAGEGKTGIRWAEKGTERTGDYESYLTFTQAGGRCNRRNYWLDVHIQVFRAGELLVFETIPEENTNEIYYEGQKSYPITQDRYHTGDEQNQNATNACVVNLDMFNCFAFGNGVESFKIEDGLAKPGFKIGARVTAVSEQDYKESHRYTDITYSGVYNDETNLNKLNEFNLGLVNFKTLEKSFGPVEVIHARQKDILVLQEDKISYVLLDKNLLSDAGAGGSIVSTPAVLGTQLARIEEFGISNHPESFAVHGFDVFFTDQKRGSVINLRGGQGPGDQLNIVSSLGMRSWFRNEFIDNMNNIQLGGYDPYMNEYVLSFTDNDLDIQRDTIDCGFTVAQQNSNTPITYTVNLDEYNGEVDVDYDVTAGSLHVLVTYDGTDVIDQSVTGSGTLTFSRNQYNVNNCVVVLTPTSATYELDFGCVQAQQLTVIRIVKNTNYMETQSIHHEYFWEANGYTSPVTTDSVTFGEGPVSLYESFTNYESSGGAPEEGAIVTMRHKKLASDLAEWDYDKFKYLVSDTLYDESDINTLSPLLQEATPINNPATDVYEASFTYANPSDHQYLYLVWDYIEPQIECSDTLSASGSEGIYEIELELGTDTGIATIQFDSLGIPDRFEILWDGSVVADSLFVGDDLPDTTNENLIINADSLPVYRYNGTSFSQSTTEPTRNVNFTSAHISNSSTARPTSGDGSIGNQLGVVGGFPTGTPLASDGNVKLEFNKDTAYPTKATIRVTGVNTGTAWNIQGVECPIDTTPVEPVEYDVSEFFLQDWAWQDDVDPQGGSTEHVVVIELTNGNWYYDILNGSGLSGFESEYPIGSTIDLSDDMSGPFASDTLAEEHFEQTVGGSLITDFNYVSVNTNNYTIVE